MDVVFAVRQSDSAPTCEKPTVMTSPLAVFAEVVPDSAADSATDSTTDSTVDASVLDAAVEAAVEAALDAVAVEADAPPHAASDNVTAAVRIILRTFFFISVNPPLLIGVPDDKDIVLQMQTKAHRFSFVFRSIFSFFFYLFRRKNKRGSFFYAPRSFSYSDVVSCLAGIRTFTAVPSP
jgi:hypothetical protein